MGCLSLAQQTSGMSTLPTPGHQVQELGDLNLKVFEAYCPHAYSYAFDDNNSTFFCMNTNYHVLSQQNYYVSSVTLAFGFRKLLDRDLPLKISQFFLIHQIIKEPHAMFNFNYPCFSIFSGLKITRGGFVGPNFSSVSKLRHFQSIIKYQHGPSIQRSNTGAPRQSKADL